MDKTARSALVCACLLLLGCGGTLAAQPRRQSSRDVRRLINKLEDQNEFVALDASRKLIRLGPRVIAPLIESLKRNENCDFQFYAVEVIRKIDPSREIVKSTLIDVAKGDCNLSAGMHAALVNFAATRVLLEEIPGGIPLVAQWLSDNDESMRSQAAIAFDGLAELIQQNRLVRVRTKEIINETSAAIPLLAKALDDQDNIVRCRSYAALWRMQQSSYKELRAKTHRVLQGITDPCS